jgi:hypothetical protein
VVEAADEEGDAEEGGDGGTDGDVEDLDAAHGRTCMANNRTTQRWLRHLKAKSINICHTICFIIRSTQ